MVDKSSFVKGIDRLCKFHTKKLNKDQVGEWYKMIYHVNTFDFNDGVESCMRKEKFFPTPDKLLAHSDQARSVRATGIRNSNESKVKRTLGGMAGTEIKNVCGPLIMQRFEGKINSFELSEKMYDLEDKFPGLGFKEEAAKILKKWEARNDS